MFTTDLMINARVDAALFEYSRYASRLPLKYYKTKGFVSHKYIQASAIFSGRMYWDGAQYMARILFDVKARYLIQLWDGRGTAGCWRTVASKLSREDVVRALIAQNCVKLSEDNEILWLPDADAGGFFVFFEELLSLAILDLEVEGFLTEPSEK